MRMGIIGAAGITGRSLIEPARSVDEVEICAIAARNPARAETFAKEHAIPVVYSTYQALLEDTSLDAIYVPLANSLHAKWTIAALDAGHHVLCEKPLASNAIQAAAMVDAAERNHRFLIEAFHWRYHPVANRMIELSKLIGPLERVEARFAVSIPSDNIRFDLELGGGSFMDLGSYCMHMVRTVVGTEPEVTRAVAVEGPRGVDVSMEADLSFEGIADAFVSSSMVAERTVWPDSMVFRAWGQAGELEVLNPMAPQFAHRIRAKLEDGSTVDEVLEARTSYEYQLRAFCKVVAGEEPPITGGADAVANMRAIDAVYELSGLGARP
ncbi:MAG: putative oxidoreductase [Acidimicrobiaceae bacterium]|jgi:predicted dehydrogenase|nr:putative oxidoreductase [Acidimicrobiaceae bacterium]